MDYQNTYVIMRKKTGLKYLLFLSFLFIFLLNAGLVFAQEVNYPRLPGAQAPQDFLTTAAREDIPGLWVKYIINLCTWGAGFIAFLMLVWGGVEFLISTGDPIKIIDARKRMSNAFLGLLIILSAYFILVILSPYFVDFTLPEIDDFRRAVQPPSAPPQPENSSVDVYIPLGRIIENIFQTYNSNPSESEIRAVAGEEKPFVPETLTRIQRINNILDATLYLLPPIQERTDNLEDLSDDCECFRNTDPYPSCRSGGCFSLLCSSDPCDDVRGEIVSTEKELLPYLFEIEEGSLPGGSPGELADLFSGISAVGGIDNFESIANTIQDMGGTDQLESIINSAGGIDNIKGLVNLVSGAGGIENFTGIISGINGLGGMEGFASIVDNAGGIENVKDAIGGIIGIGGLENIELIISKAGSIENLEDVFEIIEAVGGIEEIEKTINDITGMGGTDEINDIINKAGSIDDLEDVIGIIRTVGGTEELEGIIGDVGSLGGLGGIDGLIDKAGSIEDLASLAEAIKAAEETEGLMLTIFGVDIRELEAVEKLARILGDIGTLGGTEEIDKMIDKIDDIDDLEDAVIFIREAGGIDALIEKLRVEQIEQTPEVLEVMNTINKLGGLEEVRNIIISAGGIHDMEGVVKVINAAGGTEMFENVLEDIGLLGGLGAIDGIIDRAGSVDDLKDVVDIIKTVGGTEEIGAIFGDIGAIGGIDDIEELIGQVGSIESFEDVIGVIKTVGDMAGLENAIENIVSLGGLESIDDLINKAGSIDNLKDVIGVIKDIGGLDDLRTITNAVGGLAQFGSVVNWIEAVGGNAQAASIIESIDSLGGIGSLGNIINSAGGLAQISNVLNGIENIGGINQFETLANGIGNIGAGGIEGGAKTEGIDGIIQHDAYGRPFAITTNLTKELAKTEKEIKDLKYWFNKLGRAEELIRECDWATLSNRNQYLQKKDYFQEKGWAVDDVSFWDDATISFNRPISPASMQQRWYPSPGTPLEPAVDESTLYCTVGGTVSKQPIYFEKDPYFLEVQAEYFKDLEGKSLQELEELFSSELSCDINIPYGEILDKAHRLTRLLINKLELIADREKKILEASEKMQESISRCSSRLCFPICIPLPHGGCLEIGCFGPACPGDIDNLAEDIRRYVQEIQEAITGVPSPEDEEQLFLTYYKDVGIKYIFSNLAADLLQGMEQTLRKRMPLCTFEKPVDSDVAFWPCSKALGGTEQAGRVITNCFEGTVNTGDWKDTLFGGCLNNCFLTKMSVAPSGNNTNVFESSLYKKCMNDCMGSICLYNYDHNLNFFCCHTRL